MWKRLRPDSYDWYEPNAVPHALAPVTGTVPHRGSRAGPHTAAADPTAARYDEPIVRHVRRGTMADALAALGAMGATAFVDALLDDRYSSRLLHQPCHY